MTDIIVINVNLFIITIVSRFVFFIVILDSATMIIF